MLSVVLASPRLFSPEHMAQLQRLAREQASVNAFLDSDLRSFFAQATERADSVALHGLFPLALTLLIVHELYSSTSEGRPFGVRSIALRTIGCAGLLYAYGFIVSLIMSAAGGGGGWASWDAIMGPITRGFNSRMEGTMHLDAADIMGWLLWLVLFAIAALFAVIAYAAALLLSISQGVLLLIVLGLGKTAIVVSLVPGVGLGASWARYLAMLCAWSLVGGSVQRVMFSNPLMQASGDLLSLSSPKMLLGLSAIYLVFAIFTLSVPSITSALFSGVASRAPGVMGAMAAGLLYGRAITRGGIGKIGLAKAARSKGGGDGRHPGGGAGGSGEADRRRPHKTSRRADRAGDHPPSASASSQAANRGSVRPDKTPRSARGGDDTTQSPPPGEVANRADRPDPPLPSPRSDVANVKDMGRGESRAEHPQSSLRSDAANVADRPPRALSSNAEPARPLRSGAHVKDKRSPAPQPSRDRAAVNGANSSPARVASSLSRHVPGPDGGRGGNGGTQSGAGLPGRAARSPGRADAAPDGRALPRPPTQSPRAAGIERDAPEHGRAERPGGLAPTASSTRADEGAGAPRPSSERSVPDSRVQAGNAPVAQADPPSRRLSPRDDQDDQDDDVISTSRVHKVRKNAAIGDSDGRDKTTESDKTS